MLVDIDSKLFPPPARNYIAKNPLAPRIWPGVTPESTTMVQFILTDNYKKFHVFFNDRGFLNHSAHAALTLWALGADKSILESSYQASSEYQRPAFESPNSVTRQNWTEFLGRESYYQAYREFFQQELSQKDFSTVLEEYVFGTNANFILNQDADEQPEMLSRFYAGLVHPMIHIGFGLEFNLPGTLAEGLAQAAVHPPESTNALSASFFNQFEGGVVAGFTSSVGLVSGQIEKKDVHALTVLARVLADSSLALDGPPGVGRVEAYRTIIAKYGQTIQKHVNEWSLEGDLQKKVEELLWTNTILYVVAGYEKTGLFNADFFIMHLVTSSIFLSTIFVHLKRSSQILLLKGYFSISLGYFVARGKPQLDFDGFFNDPKTRYPASPGPQPIPHEAARPSPDSVYASTPNPWLPIIQSALAHSDDHLPKLQRALVEYASYFGNTPAGTFAGTELKGAELVDGTLFVRAAGLTASRLGWVREGQAPLEGVWDRRGFTA